jgi:hypothetical protein
MKKLILLIAIALMFTSSYAQVLMLNDVPAVVSKAFVKSHPKVTTVEWTKAGDNFKANYVTDEMKMSATYNAKGKLTQTENQISVASLPTPTLKYLNENFKDSNVKMSSKNTTSKGKVTYNVKIKDVDLVFDVNGKYIKPTA